MSYLFIDVNDVILAECESPNDVQPILEQLREEQPEREVLVGWFDEHQGELVSTQAFVTARGLSAEEALGLYARPQPW